MEIKDLEKALESYYGKHASNHVQQTTMDYIDNTYTYVAFQSLFREIMKTHPFNYGFPDVSAIEKASEYYYQKNNNKSLKKTQKPENEFTYKYEPLTDEERKQAEPEHEKFTEFMKEIVAKKTDKEEKKYCKDCTHFGKDKSNYNCRGCINHKNFEENQV
jgi:hypothetical protein